MHERAAQDRSSVPQAPEEAHAEGADPEIVLEVPRILCDCVAGRRELTLKASTIASALRELGARWPTLATHVLDEAGAIRQHVLLLHNGKLTKYLSSLDVPLCPGDRLQIVQAVSGG